MITNNFTTIDEYIAGCPPRVAALLQTIRETIRAAAPEAEETIAYMMPAFKQHGPVAYFAAFKNHIGFFPTSTGIAAFQHELSGFKTSKGTLQLPLDQPLPLDLITQIVQFKVAENLEKAALKKAGKKKSS